MAKTANLYARIEPEVKEQAEGILAALGIPVSGAINMFYKQIIIQRGIPFDLKLPTPANDISAMNKTEFDNAIAKGYMDCVEGRTQKAETAFEEIHKEFGL